MEIQAHFNGLFSEWEQQARVALRIYNASLQSCKEFSWKICLRQGREMTLATDAVLLSFKQLFLRLFSSIMSKAASLASRREFIRLCLKSHRLACPLGV